MTESPVKRKREINESRKKRVMRMRERNKVRLRKLHIRIKATSKRERGERKRI